MIQQIYSNVFINIWRIIYGSIYILYNVLLDQYFLTTTVSLMPQFFLWIQKIVTTQSLLNSQWLMGGCFLLLSQAIMFYIPRYLWKVWEAGKVKMLVMQLNSPIVDDEAKRERKSMLVNYFAVNMHNHNFYFFKFFICELLNFANVVGQIYFTDRWVAQGFEFCWCCGDAFPNLQAFVLII